MRSPAPKQTPLAQQAPTGPVAPEARPSGAGEPGYSVLDLQRTVGNQALQRVLRQPAGPGAPPAVGPPPVHRRIAPSRLQRAPDPPGGAGSSGAGGVPFKYSVRIDKVLSGDELLLVFVQQYRNLPSEKEARDTLTREGWKWSDKPPVVTAQDVAKRYILVTVRDSSLTASTAAERQLRKEYFEGLSAEDQGAINAEIDTQFWTRTQYRVGQLLGTSGDDPEMAVYWKVLRDELLRKRQALEALPEEIRKLLFDPAAAPPVGFQSYDAVLRIAAKIAHLSPKDLDEFRSRGFTTTAGWPAYEASVDRFLVERKEREATAGERRKLETRLYGLDEIYAQYRLYLTLLKSTTRNAMMGGMSPAALGGAIGGQSAINKARSELEAALIAAGFPGGLNDFEKLIGDYEQVFDRETRALAQVMLDQYEQSLIAQEAAYRQPGAGQALYGALQQSGAGNDYRAAEAVLREPPSSNFSDTLAEESDRLTDKIERYQGAKGRAEAKMSDLAKAHPLVAETDFDREALARAWSPMLAQAQMLSYIASRRADVVKTRQNLRDKPRMIYGLNTLLQASMQAQGIQGGTLYAKIIQDHISDENWTDAIPKFVLGVIGVIAGLLTGGGGTIAVVAAGTALGIGAYQALEEFRHYEMKSAARGARLTSDDPSFAWVVVAVIGAGLDAAALVSLLPRMRPALEAFQAGAEANDVGKLTQKLQGLGPLEAAEDAVRQAVIRAADAQAEARAAWRAVFRPPAALRVVIVPGAEEFGRLVYAVYMSLRQGIRDFQVFLRTSEAMDLIGDAAKLTDEELALLKTGYLQAVDEIEAIAVHGRALAMADNEIRAFMNLRGNTKGMTADQLKEQMSAWKKTKESSVPFGFKDAEQLEGFQKAAATELKKALKKTDPKAEAFLQGSSLTGVSYKRHLPFDEASDFDVAITSRYLMNKAEREFGLEVKLSPRRIGPLTREQAADLGLDKFIKRLGENAEQIPAGAGGATTPRKVNIMLFDNAEAVTKPIGQASTEAERAALPLKGK